MTVIDKIRDIVRDIQTKRHPMDDPALVGPMCLNPQSGWISTPQLTLDDLRELLAELEQRWQAIETCPAAIAVKGVIVCVPGAGADGPFVGEAHLCPAQKPGEQWFWAGEDPLGCDGNSRPIQPTHWMPLPPFPGKECAGMIPACARCGSALVCRECVDCGGEGHSEHDCGEDCCNCVHPEPNIRCSTCGGKGDYLECPICDPDDGA